MLDDEHCGKYCKIGKDTESFQNSDEEEKHKPFIV